MPGAYIFDLDGTLVDSYRALAASVNYVRAMAGLPPLTVPAVRRIVGGGLQHLVESCVPGFPVEQAVACFREHHPSVISEGTRLLPGARAVLRTLAGRGRRIALASNKPGDYCARILEFCDLARHVDEIWDPIRAGAPKPDPAMLLGAARSLGASNGGAVYVGDMVIDITVARSAGLPVWVVATGGSTLDELRTAAPDRLLQRLTDIVELDIEEPGRD